MSVLSESIILLDGGTNIAGCVHDVAGIGIGDAELRRLLPWVLVLLTEAFAEPKDTSQRCLSLSSLARRYRYCKTNKDCNVS